MDIVINQIATLMQLHLAGTGSTFVLFLSSKKSLYNIETFKALGL